MARNGIYGNWAETLNESEQVMVSGPGIELLRRTVADMASRGAPTEYNDFGFSKNDWNTYTQLAQYVAQTSMPPRIASTLLRMLGRYRNTQVRNFEEISRAVAADLGSLPQPADGASMDGEKIHVHGDQPLTYGKVKVYIPHGVDVGDMREINKIVDDKMREENAPIVTDSYGREGYQRFKKFSKDRDNPSIFHIHAGIVHDVVELLRRRRNLEVSGTMPAAPEARPTPQSGPEVEILGKATTSYGQRVKVKFNVPFERTPYPAIKAANLVPFAASYSVDDHQAGNRGVVLINIDDKAKFEKVRNVIAQKGINVAPLDHFAQEHFESPVTSRVPAPPTEAEARESHRMIKAIHFEDLPGAKMKVKVQYNHPELRDNFGKKDFIKELIQYTFPSYEWNKPGYFYEVEGNFQQFVTLGELMKRFGYDVQELRGVLIAKLDSGRMERQKYVGQYDQGEMLEKVRRDVNEKLPDSSYELYPQQVEGVAFLYGRHHAILGDETGFGKTAQLVTAAALRMKEESRPTLIVTLKATAPQWVTTVKAVCGDEESGDISTDGANPKKWTILYYENFQAGKKLPDVIKACKEANFGIAIFDELHKLKHESSKRSANIAAVTENIPTVWGASATISANKPMDVRNQLAVLKHHLGKIKEGRFKRDFAGAKVGDYGYVIDPHSDDSYRAAERLNRWLNLSGVYVRRSKSDVRDMPNLNRIEPRPQQVDEAEFNRKYLDKLSTYENPNLAVSKLIAAREVVAQLKTDDTTRKVIKIVRDNMENPANNYAASKVVVFTNFVESANQLVSKIAAGLRSINPAFEVVTYLAMTKKSERDKVKQRFGRNPNAKVLVMSLRMGGTGIDFPNEARNMVINDFDWTPESAEQSEGRIYRINTDHSVNIDYTLAKGIDEELYKKVQRKRELAAIIQKYRKELHKKEHDPELLQRIIDAQKEMRRIDDTMADVVANQLPSSRNETFGDYFRSRESIKEHLFGI